MIILGTARLEKSHLAFHEHMLYVMNVMNVRYAKVEVNWTDIIEILD